MESVSVPGRVLCSGDQAALFNDEIGTVSCAVDLRLHIAIESRPDNRVSLHCPLMSHTAPLPEVFEGLHDDALVISNGDRQVASYPILRKILDQVLKSRPNQGFTIELTADDGFSFGAGLGSSTAFLIGLFAALGRFFGRDLTAETIATRVAALETELYEDARPSDAHVIAYGGFVRDTGGSIDHSSLSIPLVIGLKQTKMNYYDTAACALGVQNTHNPYTKSRDGAKTNTEAIWNAVVNDDIDQFADLLTLSGSELEAFGVENWPLPIARKRVLAQGRQSSEKTGVKQSGFGDRSLLVGFLTEETKGVVSFTQAMDQIGGETVATATTERGIKAE